MPWPMSQPLSVSQRTPLSTPSFSPFNDTSLGQRLKSPATPSQGQGEVAEGDPWERKRQTLSQPHLLPPPPCSELSNLQANAPPVAQKGAPPCVGGCRSHSSTCRLPRLCQQCRDTTSCARRVWIRAVSSCPPAGVLDRVNTAASSVLASSQAPLHRVG